MCKGPGACLRQKSKGGEEWEKKGWRGGFLADYGGLMGHAEGCPRKPGRGLKQFSNIH